MRNLAIVLSLSLSLFATVQCSTSQKEDSKSHTVEWKAGMHKLALSVSKLLPMALTPGQFNAPENSATIRKEMRNIVEVSQDLKGHMPSDDPILKFTNTRFRQDMSYAYQQFKVGNTDIAQTTIRNSTTYCLGCHTRNNQGRQLDWKWGVDLGKMQAFDRAQYLAAIRDFDGALGEYIQILTSKELAQKNPRVWDLSARKSLAIAVRVKRDPQLANELLTKFLDAKAVPPSKMQTSLHWRDSVKEWMKEKAPQQVTPNQSLKSAKKLLQKGWKAGQFPEDGAGLIYFLRASSLLHDLLEQNIPDSLYGEALYDAGLVAERLKETNLWTLHQAYYEACIERVPRTAQAKKCYLRYEAVTLADYAGSGSMGEDIPSHVKAHLSHLRKKAEFGEWNEMLNWGLID